MNSAGDAKFFKYKGNGAVKTPDGKNDGQGNQLHEVFVTEGGQCYLHGEVAQKTPDREILQQIEVILKYDATVKKIRWKLLFPTIPGHGLPPTLLYRAGENIVRTVDVHTFNIYNSNGYLSSSPMQFLDTVYLGTGMPSPYDAKGLQGPIPEVGYFYATAESDHNYYLVKYSIAGPLADKNFSALVAIPEETMLGFALQQNYPNPFNPTTTIEFTLSEPSIVTLKVYNLLGQEVGTLLNNEMVEEGEQSIEFEPSGLPSGVYFYHLTVQDQETGNLLFHDVKKMLFMK
jgi:Secretion system C-terminal sorting domain